MQCSHCNQEHPENSQFCPVTGRKIITPVVCPECGMPIDSKWRHCTHCGCKLIQAEGIRSQEAQAAGNPQASLPISDFSKILSLDKPLTQGEITVDSLVQKGDFEIGTKTCPKCEEINPGHIICCAKCGASLSNIPVTQTAKDANNLQVAAKAQEKGQPGLQFEVYHPTGEVQTFDSTRDLSEDILRGVISKSLKARTVSINQDGKRTESKWSTVEKIATSHAELRSLYKPIWDYTIKFLTYGAYVGFALKALDTTVTLFTADTMVGIFWLAVLVSLLVASKWPAAPMVVIIASVVLGLRINLFVAVLSTMLVGFIFGAPFGMLIGTIVGLFRKGNCRVAPDAELEGMRPYLLGIVMPLTLLAITIPLYIWLNTKLAEWLF